MKKSVLIGIVVVVVAAAAAVFLFAGMQQTAPTREPTQAQKIIRIGVLCDLTGPTSDSGKFYCIGVQDALEWFERTYLLPKGYKLELTLVDYGYKIPEAQAAYTRFKALGVVAILGWGTGDTLALAPLAAQDKIPFVSVSYSAELMKKETPYNFFPQADYSTQGRAMVQFVVEKWKEMHGGNPPRPPRLGLAYPNVPYGTSPIPAIKDMAKQLGVEVCPDQIVELTATDATTQMLKLKECGADFIWAGGAALSTLVIMRDAKKVGLNAPVLINVWGLDEGIITGNPEAAEGNYYLSSLKIYDPDVKEGDFPGAKIIKEFAKEKGREPYKELHMTYIRGWANVNLLMKGVLDVINRNEEVTGENIWKALTSIRDWDFSPLTGLTVEKITITSEDRRPQMTVMFYKISNGELSLEKVIKLERKTEWLGW